MPSSNGPKQGSNSGNKRLYGGIIIKPYNSKELASMYGVHSKTLAKWLIPHEEAIGERMGNIYTTLQVQKIFTFLGAPSYFQED